MATSVQPYVDSAIQFASNQLETQDNVLNISFQRPHNTPLGLNVRRGEFSDRLVISGIQPHGCVDSALKQHADEIVILPGDAILCVNGHSGCQEKMLDELSTAHTLHVAVLQCSSSRRMLTTLKDNVFGFEKKATDGKQPGQFTSLTSTCYASQSLETLGDLTFDDAWSPDYDSDSDTGDERVPQRAKCMHELPSLPEIFDGCPPGHLNVLVPDAYTIQTSARTVGAGSLQNVLQDFDCDSESEEEDYLPQRSTCMEEFPSLAAIFDNCSAAQIHNCMPELRDKSAIVVSSEISKLLVA